MNWLDRFLTYERIDLNIQESSTELTDDQIKKYLTTCPKFTDIIQLLKNSPHAIFTIVEHSLFNHWLPKILNDLDPTVINDRKRNFLYYLSVENYIFILNSDFTFDINHIDDEKNTSIMTVFNNKNLPISSLQKRNYNFNQVNVYGRSMISLWYKPEFTYENIITFISIPEYDLLSDMTWFELLFTNYNISYKHHNNIKCIMNCIIKREDYISFLYRFINTYLSIHIEQDLILVCILISKLNGKKLQEMLSYVGDGGNTFIHLAAKNHYKKLLYLVDPVIGDIKSNDAGQTPRDLYQLQKIWK